MDEWGGNTSRRRMVHRSPFIALVRIVLLTSACAHFSSWILNLDLSFALFDGSGSDFVAPSQWKTHVFQISFFRLNEKIVIMVESSRITSLQDHNAAEY
jgi:hypothetical protein